MKPSQDNPVPYADPLHAGRHPFQTFMLSVCLVTGVPLLIGQPIAGSVNELLPAWMAFGWGMSLFLGAAIALAGSYWPRTNYATALTLERAGLVIVGPAAIVYAAIIPLFSGDTKGLVATLIALGFGGSCLKRAHDIGLVIVRAIAIAAGDPMRRARREDETP
jgi:hypothetical protein